MPRRGATPILASLLGGLLLLATPTAVQGFSPRVLSSRPSTSSSTGRRRWTQPHTGAGAGAGADADARTSSLSLSPAAATRLASSRASSEGFGDARGRSAFMDQGRIELLCKAGPDGASLGDCPFCHYVQMVLRYKGLRYRLVPLAPDDKPEWLLEGYGGKMPCLVHDEEAYTDSATITQYLEYFFPGERPLTIEDPELDEEVKAATGGVFGAFARYVKNVDKAQDAALKEALFAELGKIDALLGKTGGPYLAGQHISLDDMALAPKLYHVKVAIAQFKNVIMPPALGHLQAYLNRMLDLDIFQQSSYPPDVITWGWGNARAAAAAAAGAGGGGSA